MSNPYQPANSPLEQPRYESRRLPYSGWWPVLGGALAGFTLRLIFSGSADNAYAAMLSSFIIGSPVLVGAVTVYLAELGRRRSWNYYFVAPMIATLLYVVGTLVALIEGWICAIIILPLFALVGGLAGLAMGAICRATNWPRRAVVSCVAALPLLGGAVEQLLPSAERERTQLRELWVATPPQRVWRELVDVPPIGAHEIDAWMYRIGVPLPTSLHGELRQGEHLRHVSMGKGIHFEQVATEWRENSRVSWRHHFDADSFPPGALDDHVRIGGQYFDVGDTTFSLLPERGGTRLKIQMRYRVSTHFNWYAGPVADFLVGDFAEQVLGFYARRAQRGVVRPGP